MKLQTSLLAGVALLALNESALASGLGGRALENAANAISWVVLIGVPIAGVYLFWILHIWPERIAHRKRHPQKEAIHALCLLSLFFGGLLWPLAWLWAHTKPVFYRAAYGTDIAPEDEASPGQAGDEPSTTAAHGMAGGPPAVVAPLASATRTGALELASARGERI